ncbi:MAG TPA: PfkB family carbohydrate kinase, partial [Candidatus Krumholzibacterium sp.]|nr:PfkB family carbohydrate kinase [Candidatus Krumholzibacterium sp.]
MSIVIVGSVAFDTIETPAGRAERAVGGSAVYSSLVASNFCPVKIVGVVGDDFGPEHRAVLEEREIDLEGLETVPGGKTFFWEGRYGADPNERDTIVTELNVFESFSPRLPDSYLDTRFLFLGNIDPVLQISVLDQLDDGVISGCDTMNYWIESRPEELRKLLAKVDILFVNDSEARQLSGEKNLLHAGRAILRMGPSAVVLKKGEHGAMLMTEEMIFITPAYPLENVSDPTGAGDSFAGGFMASLAATGSMKKEALRRAMVYGTVSASFT